MGKILQSIAIAAVLCGIGLALNVVQVMDDVILERGQFIILQNFNEAKFIEQDANTFNQSLTIQVTNKFENYLFDVFIFDVDEETGESPDFKCYLDAITTQDWNRNCSFGTNGLTTEILRR